MGEIVKGFKVFNPNWTCRGFKYRVGKTYFHKGYIGICKAGFHFCQRAADCFSYYGFNPKNKVAEVEALGLVETKEYKSVTNCIRIVREIPWEELLTIVNTGEACTGLRNTGDRNTGHCNTGNSNAGNENTGDMNVGYWNTGNRNVGNHNAGCWNIGSWNTGNHNVGNYNAGSWNSGNWNVGFFNTDEPFVRFFNKPTNLRMSEFITFTNKGLSALCRNYEDKLWIPSDHMSDVEKAAHPEHVTTGGYVKPIPFREACLLMWARLTDEEKEEVKQIPNFDPEIFEEITGIRTQAIEDQTK